MATKILFNGQEYGSPDRMPPAVRQAYEAGMASVRNGNLGGALK